MANENEKKGEPHQNSQERGNGFAIEIKGKAKVPPFPTHMRKQSEKRNADVHGNNQ